MKRVTISYSNDITRNFKTIKIDFTKMLDLVKSDFNYSAGSFKDGYRKKDNYLNYCDMIILDIDEGLTIKQAKDIFMPFDYIIATTKSHMKSKNGVVCERFRVLIPTETPITLNKDEYSLLMGEIFKEYNFVDKVCKDASRFYYPSKDSETYLHGGFCGFYWQDYWEKALENKIQKKQEKILIYNFESSDDDTSKLRYLRKHRKTDKFLDFFKSSERFVSGQRNTFIYSVAHTLLDLGMSNDEIRDNIYWVNNQGDSISEKELESTVFRSLRV